MALDPADIAVVSRLLDEALALPPDARGAWLAALSPEHRRHARTLQDMLTAEALLGTDDPLSSLPRVGGVDEEVGRAGEIVGPYRLLDEIGRGGMGSVWRAARADGTLKRQIALKLPRLAWGGGLAERMARERDIGALLDHPNIARLYDAGVDDRGRPYLALEFVDGRPIDAWCAAQGLDVRGRLRLFLQVVRAVAHAHGRLVVHRDLKPSNVLVTPDGQAHLLDFGIAKLLDEGGRDDTGLTQRQGRVMTPRYASPEQVTGEAITVQSDIYSLGVLLYELLTGTLPIAPRRGTPAAMEDAILRGDVALASSRATDSAAAKALRGEIDAILNKALKREPSQRYATADALAQDIERFFDGRPVLAQPDSLGYRLAKVLRRHRLGFGASGAVLVAVLAGAAVSFVQAERAHAEAERARVVKEFVVDVFKVNERNEPSNSELRQLPAELLLEHGARLIASRFRGQPRLQAELYGVVGSIFADMGSAKLAAEYATRQIEALTATGAGAEDLARAMLLLAESLAAQDQLADAATRARRANELSAGHPASQLRAHVVMGRILIAHARYAEARLELDWAQRALQTLDRPLSLEQARLQAEVDWQRAAMAADPAESASLFDKAIQVALAAEGASSRLAADIRLDLAYRLAGQSRGPEAMRHLGAALAAMRSMGGADDIAAAMAQSRVMAMLFDSDQIAFHDAFEAITGAQQIIARQGPRIPDGVRARLDFDLGWIFRQWGNVDRAYALQGDAVRKLRPGAQSPFALQVLETSLGMDAMETGRHQEADELLRRGLEWRKINLGGGPMLTYGFVNVAWNLMMQGRHAEAERELDAGPPSRPVTQVRAQLRVERGDWRGALQWLDSIEPQPPDDERLAIRGRALCGIGEVAQGLGLLEEVIGRTAARLYEHAPLLAHLRSLAGLCALSAGRRGQAAALAALARGAFQRQPGVSPYYKAPLLQLESALARR